MPAVTLTMFSEEKKAVTGGEGYFNRHQYMTPQKVQKPLLFIFTKEYQLRLLNKDQGDNESANFSLPGNASTNYKNFGWLGLKVTLQTINFPLNLVFSASI